MGQTQEPLTRSNIGIATEDSVISSGLPTANLESREFNVDVAAQQLMNTSNVNDYGGERRAGRDVAGVHDLQVRLFLVARGLPSDDHGLVRFLGVVHAQGEYSQGSDRSADSAFLRSPPATPPGRIGTSMPAPRLESQVP